jgi:hypothetical protein
MSHGDLCKDLEWSRCKDERIEHVRGLCNAGEQRRVSMSNGKGGCESRCQLGVGRRRDEQT